MARHDYPADGDQGRPVCFGYHAGVGGGIASGSTPIDWAWITGRIITATGWTFDTLNEQSFIDVSELLQYWAEEPPAHVTLALRYLGTSKRGKPVDEGQARKDMGELARVMGQQAAPLPANLKAMVQAAEQMKKQHKGITVAA